MLSLGRDHRIKKRIDYVFCYERGKRIYSRNFIVFSVERPGALWRFGLAVAKKVGCAVVRNRVKRVLREFFRLNQERMGNGLDMVVIPRRSLNPAKLTLAAATRELLPVLESLESGGGGKAAENSDKLRNQAV